MPITDDVRLGRNTKIFHPQLVNLYGCSIGGETTIGPYIEIQHGVNIGARCKISSHTFICEGVTIEDEVFIGHGVMFINDKYPCATTQEGELKTADDWILMGTLVRRRASIGSNATILCNIIIGECAMVGAGSVVTHDVPDYCIVAGVPAKIIGDVRHKETTRIGAFAH